MNKISKNEINSQLEGILRFPSFKNSPTLSNFLSYIVTETLNGNQHFIKEYPIAVHVLNRPIDFNSQDDSIVRTHAGRLRKILDDYYSTDGQNDLILINVPKGCYIPEFTYKDKIHPKEPLIETTDPIGNPIIVIFPFKSNPQKQNLEIFSELLCEELTCELSRFEDISVTGHFSSEIISKINENILEAARLLCADFILTGNLQCNDKKLQIRVNLLDSTTGKISMTKSFEHENLEDIVNIQKEIVQNVVCELGGYYGIIFKEIIKTSPIKISDNLSIWKGIYSYYKYQRFYTIENYKSAFTNLNNAVKIHSNHAVTWAMLGELYLDGVVLAMGNNENRIEKGNRCVMKSLKIDPNCQHAWYSQTWLSLFKKDPVACLHSAEQCRKINPNSSGMVSGVGCMIIFAGYFEEGFLMMENAIQTNPHYSWCIHIGYSYYYIYKKDYVNALYWAEKMESEETFWDPLLKAVSLSFLNEDIKAKKYLSKLLEMEPTVPKEIKNMISSHILSEELVTDIIGSLERIGLVLVD